MRTAWSASAIGFNCSAGIPLLVRRRAFRNLGISQSRRCDQRRHQNQLYEFKDGSRGGMSANAMKRLVANLMDDDIIAISAYLASRPPA